MRDISRIVLFSAVGLMGVSCTGTPSSQKPMILVSVPPQGTMVQRIAGDAVEVTVLIPPQANPVTHEPGFREMEAAGKANIYFVLGHPAFPFERTWLDRLSRDQQTLRIVNTTADVPLLPGDPHVWVSPRAARAMAAVIHTALSEELSQDTESLHQNWLLLDAELAELDKELRTKLEPHRGREIYVFHPSWGYLTHEYGLKQIALEHHGKEASSVHLESLIQQARKQPPGLVLVQPQFSDRAAKVFADEIGASLLTSNPLSDDWINDLRNTINALIEVWETGS